MAMDFSRYDARHYPTLSVRDGYTEWAKSYGSPVLEHMDLPLFEQLLAAQRYGVVLDLACGTGRIGGWLRRSGRSEAVDGVDFTEAMLEQARTGGQYRTLMLGDIRHVPFEARSYGLIVQSLACEHLPDLGPLYREVARLLSPGGTFALVGYHPFFLMRGVPTHFVGSNGQPVAVEASVHLLSDHFRALNAAGLTLTGLEERVVDESFVALKDSWQRHVGWPITFGIRANAPLIKGS